MTLNEKILKRIDFVLRNSTSRFEDMDEDELTIAEMKGFRSSGLSLILDLFGEKHPYYREFFNATRNSHPMNVLSGKYVLNNIREEVENGWLSSLKGIVSAEIFGDFLEMANHLLQNDYKDAAAVMIGGVLEEHLRQMCLSNNIEVAVQKGHRKIPKKADAMNNDLAKAGVYNKLVLKNITANLDLRNKAAHGSYSEYQKEQVQNMLDAVSGLIIQYPI